MAGEGAADGLTHHFYFFSIYEALREKDTKRASNPSTRQDRQGGDAAAASHQPRDQGQADARPSPARAAPSGPADGGAGRCRNDDRSPAKGPGQAGGAALSGPAEGAALSGPGAPAADGVPVPQARAGRRDVNSFEDEVEG